MNEITLGDVRIARIDELAGALATPEGFLPESTPEDWARHASTLGPDFMPSPDNLVNATVQTWLIRSEGRVILVDTGLGNGKYRPYFPHWSYLDSGYLKNLADAGVAPEDVDLVINTHLHIDHVGWNTYREGAEWVPTFPNAKHLVNRRDFEFWNPENGRTSIVGRGNQNVFEDSILPVHQAGLVELWDDSHRIDGNLRLDLAAGHTPGSAVVSLASGSDRAVFVGDLVHHPLQVLEPHINSCFCEDPAEARLTRRRVLGRAADEGALLIPAHFGGYGAVEVQRRGETFALSGWAPFDV